MGTKGYKFFNYDWTCRGFRFEVGKKYEFDGKISMCSAGFFNSSTASSRLDRMRCPLDE